MVAERLLIIVPEEIERIPDNNVRARPVAAPACTKFLSDVDGENPEINKIASWNSSLAKLNGKSYELAVHVIQAALHDEYFVKNKLPGKYFSRQLYSYNQLIQQKISRQKVPHRLLRPHGILSKY